MHSSIHDGCKIESHHCAEAPKQKNSTFILKFGLLFTG
jgi:hypothetical protein